MPRMSASVTRSSKRLAGLRRFDLALVLAQLGRDQRQPEARVELLLRRHRQLLLADRIRPHSVIGIPCARARPRSRT